MIPLLIDQTNAPLVIQLVEEDRLTHLRSLFDMSARMKDMFLSQKNAE